MTCGADGDVRIWDGLDDDDPKFITVGEKVYSLALKVGHLLPSGCVWLKLYDWFVLRPFVSNHCSSCRWFIKTCSPLFRKTSWWRRARTTRCRSTHFLTVIQMAFWPGLLPMPHMSPSTTVAQGWLLDPGTERRRVTWKSKVFWILITLKKLKAEEKSKLGFVQT